MCKWEEDFMKFNDKLTTLRKSHGYTQEQLAEQLGVSRQAVSRWELGDTTPEMNILIQLCRVFDVSADYLINDEYESDNDIPVVKKKEHEVREQDKKSSYIHLFSSVCFCIATICLMNWVNTARSSSEFGIAIVICGLCSFNAVVQLGLFIRKYK